MEEISESIHAQRKFKQKLDQFREPGVGAEEYLKSLPSFDLDECCERSTISGQSCSRVDSDSNYDESDSKQDEEKSVSRTMSCPEQIMKNLSLKESQSWPPKTVRKPKWNEKITIMNVKHYTCIQWNCSILNSFCQIDLFTNLLIYIIYISTYKYLRK